MTGAIQLEFLARFVNACAVYIVVKLGRAVQISIVMSVMILFLRKTVLRKNIFGKGIIWSLLLLTPFTGKLTLYYETTAGARLFLWWQILCADFPWLPWLYIAGMVGTGSYIFYKRKKLKCFVKGMERTDVGGVKVYVSEMAVSPFTEGPIHSRIVVPKMMLEHLGEAELDMILLHEKLHIRLGHLWFYFLWDVLRILLWLNPFLTLCIKNFHADIEDICDRVSIQKGQHTAYSYGSLLLKSIRMLKAENKILEASAAFAGEMEFQNVRQRMERIVNFKPYKQITARCFIVGCGMILISAFWGIRTFSYPRYTPYKEIQIYNQTGTEVLVSDSPKLRNAIQIGEKDVYVDREALDIIFKEKGIESDIFFVYFGGFSKLPGIGGGGNGIFIDYLEDEQNLTVPYIDEESDIFMLIFKYL